jgi:hypothetical protein
MIYARGTNNVFCYVLAWRLRLQMSFQQDFDKTTVTRVAYPVPSTRVARTIIP